MNTLLTRVPTAWIIAVYALMGDYRDQGFEPSVQQLISPCLCNFWPSFVLPDRGTSAAVYKPQCSRISRGVRCLVPRWGSLQRSPDIPLAWGEGASCHLPKNPTPANGYSGLRPQNYLDPLLFFYNPHTARPNNNSASDETNEHLYKSHSVISKHVIPHQT